MVVGGEFTPVSRRRAFSDSKLRGILNFSFRNGFGSPPRTKTCANTSSARDVVPPASPTSSGYGSYCAFESISPIGEKSAPINVKSANRSSLDFSDESPRSVSSFAGLVLGSPLGSGPLNGSPVVSTGLSPVTIGSPPFATFTASDMSSDTMPMRRPRLPSLSEPPSVAPIPENFPLMDTPHRPPLRQQDMGTMPLRESLEEDNSGPPPKSTQAGDLIVSDAYRKSSSEDKQQVSPEHDAQKQALADQQADAAFRQRSGTWSMANSRRVKIRQDTTDDEAKRQSSDTPISAGRKDGQAGFFDSFRPRSKSDAKSSSQSRQRRKSGDDVLNATTKEKKKETTPSFLETFRPRSKSDAARNKKPNLMTTMKNAVQQTLVSPSNNNKSGRRSGDATPVDQPQNDVYHTWHAGSGTKTKIAKVWDLFRSNRTESTEERHRRKSGGKYDKGQLHRRHSMEPDRRRNASGSFPYIRGEDPTQSALLFRDCRGLPVAAPFLESFNRSELEQNEAQIIVKFFKYHIAYDLIPTSAKLVVFDTKLPVKKAFFALVHNGVRAAPLWDTNRQDYIGMLTITDFIRILQQFYRSRRPMNDLESYDIEEWRRMLNDEDRMLVRISPDQSLYEAIKMLINHKIHRLPVIDSITGNVLYIITHKRILKFLYLYINELPKPSVMQKTLQELGIGTYTNIQTATKDTKLIDALDVFVQHRVSALPIIDAEGKLVDIYAKFDAINLAAKGTYDNLDVTLEEANQYRNEWFEGVLKCTLNETIAIIMERIVRAEVHRLVIVDDSDIVIGIVSLSDILKELVLKPGEEVCEQLSQISISDVVKDTGATVAKTPDSPISSKSDKSEEDLTGVELCAEAVEVLK